MEVIFLMKRKTAVSTDSTADLTKEMYERYDIRKLGLFISFGDKVVQDGNEAEEVTAQAVYDFYKKTGKLTKSAAVSIAEYKDFFESLLNEGYESVVHVNISSGISATHQNACIAAAELGNVYVVDSTHLSTGQGLVALKCAELAEAGVDPSQIKEQADIYKKKVSTSFVLDTLTYMAEGGRCPTLAAYGASLLKIKPTIVMPDGKLVVGKKYRGKIENVLSEYVRDTLTPNQDYDLDRIFITHSGMDDPQIIENVKKQILDLVPFKQIYITTAGIIIATYCGPNTLGILFAAK